jgi:hypothetical protein
MSEISSINYTDGTIPSADQLDTPQRVGAADIAHLLRYLWTAAAVDAAGVVFSGLEVTGKSGDMRVDVSAGAGAIEIGATPPPQHPYNLAIAREDDVSPALSDGDGTYSRIDLVSITPASALLDQESMLLPGGSSSPQYTRRGPSYTIVVTEGTPAASPSPPGLPSGSILLAQVLVPAGLTAAGGGTASATITDYRNRRSLNVSGPEQVDKREFLTDPWATGFGLLRVEEARVASPRAIEHQFFGNDFWPIWARQNVPTDDSTDPLYPLMAPSREYWETASFNGGSSTTGPSDVTIEVLGFPDIVQYKGTVIEHVTANAGNAIVTAILPSSDRLRSYKRYKVKHSVVDATDLTSVTARAIAYDASADDIILLSDEKTLSASVGSYTTELDGNPVEFTPREGDIVAIVLACTFAAGSSGAEVRAKTAWGQVYEGRDVTP